MPAILLDVRPFTHPGPADFDLAGLLDAPGDPALAIMRALAAQGGRSCAAVGCDLPKSMLSHHFAVPCQADVLRTRRNGTRHLIERRRAEREARFPGLLDAVLRADRPAPRRRLPGRANSR